MNKQLLSNFYFDDYKVDNIEFDFNYNFEDDPEKTGEKNLEINTEVDVSIHSEENKGLLNIKMIIWDEAEKENYPFRLKISITGHFSADEEMKKEQFAKMCKYNGSAILFPFLRTTIADITKGANITPLVLPLINIQNLIDEKEE